MQQDKSSRNIRTCFIVLMIREPLARLATTPQVQSLHSSRRVHPHWRPALQYLSHTASLSFQFSRRANQHQHFQKHSHSSSEVIINSKASFRLDASLLNFIFVLSIHSYNNLPSSTISQATSPSVSLFMFTFLLELLQRIVILQVKRLEVYCIVKEYCQLAIQNN